MNGHVDGNSLGDVGFKVRPEGVIFSRPAETSVLIPMEKLYSDEAIEMLRTGLKLGEFPQRNRYVVEYARGYVKEVSLDV